MIKKVFSVKIDMISKYYVMGLLKAWKYIISSPLSRQITFVCNVDDFTEGISSQIGYKGATLINHQPTLNQVPHAPLL